MLYPALNSCTYFSSSLETVMVLAEVAAENSVSLRVEILALNTAQTLPITIPLLPPPPPTDAIFFPFFGYFTFVSMLKCKD